MESQRTSGPLPLRARGIPYEPSDVAPEDACLKSVKVLVQNIISMSAGVIHVALHK